MDSRYNIIIKLIALHNEKVHDYHKLKWYRFKKKKVIRQELCELRCLISSLSSPLYPHSGIIMQQPCSGILVTGHNLNLSAQLFRGEKK